MLPSKSTFVMSAPKPKAVTVIPDDIFVEVLAEYPIIYDKTNKDYKDKTKQSYAYNCIILYFQDLHNLSFTEAQLEAKYRSLRQQFAKASKKLNLPSGSGYEPLTAKEVFILNNMKYLEKQVQHRSTKSVPVNPLPVNLVHGSLEEIEQDLLDSLHESSFGEEESTLTDLDSVYETNTSFSENPSVPQEASVNHQAPKRFLPSPRTLQKKKKTGDEAASLFDDGISKAMGAINTLAGEIASIRSSKPSPKVSPFIIGLGERYDRLPEGDKTLCMMKLLEVIVSFEQKNL